MKFRKGSVEEDFWGKGIFLAWISLKPYLMAQKELYTTKSKLAKVLSNKELFDYFLSNSREMTSSPEGLGGYS